MAASLPRGERDAGLRWDGRRKEVGMDTPETAGACWDSCLQARCPKPQFNKAMDCDTVHNRDWLHPTLLQTWLYLTLLINHMISRHFQFLWYLLFYFQVWCLLSLSVFLLCLPCTGIFLRHQLIVNRKRSCCWDFSFVTSFSFPPQLLFVARCWHFLSASSGFLDKLGAFRKIKCSAPVGVGVHVFIHPDITDALVLCDGGSWGTSAQDNQHLSPVQYMH